MADCIDRGVPMTEHIACRQRAAGVLEIAATCYDTLELRGGARMKRVNLVEYFDLAEKLQTAKRSTSASSNKGGVIWVGMWGLPDHLRSFIADDNGFSACKHVASELTNTIESWINSNVMDGGSPPSVDTEKLDQEFNSWQYSAISSKIDAFKSVFQAECRDVDVYSVGQISIYKTSALVSNGAGVIPEEIHKDIPSEAIIEFNSAGRCLAFDLPTACGFHALRGLELVMDSYLRWFGIDTVKMKSWNDYIQEAQKLSSDNAASRKPSAKVAAMLDRMRQLERNPLMHPRDTLDEVQADMLFRLCAITVVEIARDMKANAPKKEIVEIGGDRSLVVSGSRASKKSPNTSLAE